MAVSSVGLLMKVLSSAETVKAVVADRIFAEVAPQDVGRGGVLPLPYIVLRLVGSSETSTLDGPSGLQDARIVIIAHAGLFASADAAAVAAAEVAKQFRGEVDGVQVTMFRQGVDTSDFLSDRKLFRRAVEIRLIFNG